MGSLFCFDDKNKVKIMFALHLPFSFINVFLNEGSSRYFFGSLIE